MKRAFLALTMLLSLSAFGQEIKFMGLNLGMNVEEFCKALKSKGLKQTIDRFEENEFEGTFATYPGCRIIVKATEVSKKVKSVEVQFNSIRGKEYEVDSAFDAIVEQYKNKYGDKLTKEPYDKFMGMETCNVKDGDLNIQIDKFTPSALSPDRASSLSVFYFSKNLQQLKEVNPNKHSDDI